MNISRGDIADAEIRCRKGRINLGLSQHWVVRQLDYLTLPSGKGT